MKKLTHTVLSRKQFDMTFNLQTSGQPILSNNVKKSVVADLTIK